MSWVTCDMYVDLEPSGSCQNEVKSSRRKTKGAKQSNAGTPSSVCSYTLMQGSAETEHSSTWQSAFSPKMEEQRHDPNHATESRDVPDSLQLAREREAVAKEARVRVFGTCSGL